MTGKDRAKKKKKRAEKLLHSTKIELVQKIYWDKVLSLTKVEITHLDNFWAYVQRSLLEISRHFNRGNMRKQSQVTAKLYFSLTIKSYSEERSSGLVLKEGVHGSTRHS